MFKIILASVLISLFSTSTSAEPEDWYMTFNLGPANNTNPASVENVIVSSENTYATSRLSLAAEIGLYWPVYDSSTLVGVVSNSSSDSVSNYYGANIVTHSASHVGISAIKYLTASVGDGLFVRADLGSARSVYTLFNNTFGVENGTGTAVLVGAGYSLPVSSESRLVFSLNFVNRTINNEVHSSTQFMIGGLW
ncbi:MAG: hypothetical protein OEY29_07040 [Gammaproteobacteria bacterium]|nr:hypothetical protein [Gammaproteobacteria bacterium]